MDTNTPQSKMFDQEAERGLIGAIIMGPKTLVEVGDLIDAFDFHDSYCSAVYRACLELNQENQPIDVITLGTWLKTNSSQKPENTTWPEYLYGMVEALDRSEGFSEHARAYAESIKQYSLLRKLDIFGINISSMARQPQTDGQALLEKFLGEFHAITQWWNKGRIDEVCMTKEQALEFIQNEIDSEGVAQLFNGEELPRFGFPALDGDEAQNLLPRILPLPGTATAIIADTGVGKTSLVDQISQVNEEVGQNVIFYRTEISNEFFTMRRVTRLSEVPFMNQVMSKLTRDDKRRISEIKERIANWPGRMDSVFCPGWTIEQIASDFRLRNEALETRTGKRYRVLVLDYLQKIGWSKQLVGNNESTQLSHIISRFADLSNQHNVAGILVVQPKRSPSVPEDEFIKPTLHGGLGTSAIEQRCNQVLGIWRDRKVSGQVSPAQLTILKSTFGEPNWTVDMYYYTSRFEFGE